MSPVPGTPDAGIVSGDAQHGFVPKVARNAVVEIPPTATGAYVSEFRWQGPFVTGDSSGFCGRVKRLLHEPIAVAAEGTSPPVPPRAE